jgi:hypothetical protein
MLYTKGIRKIFEPDIKTCREVEDAITAANLAGYYALNFNGIIFIKSLWDSFWQSTIFKISDFEA